jgi:hypothetical protein
MEQGEFGHRDHLCTFEVMQRAFELVDPGLRAVGEIVLEIDLQDRRFARLETAGIAAVLNGWRQAGLVDSALETHGTLLFEALYTTLAAHTA